MARASLATLISLAWAPLLVSAGCDANNCYRAIEGRSATGQAFCSQFLAGHYTSSALPTYVTPCTSGPTQISSACSCINTATAPSTTSSACATAPTPTVTLACPADQIGPFCNYVGNPEFDYGFCGWVGNAIGGDVGSIVQQSADGSFGPTQGSYMWVGTNGLSQPIGACDTGGGICSAQAHVRTTDDSCGIASCVWYDPTFTDTSQFQCASDASGPTDYTMITAEDGWTELRMPLPWGAEFGDGPLGQVWTYSVYTNCTALYVDYAGNGGCQK